MPNINDAFPSKYLKAYELKGHTPTVTIERVAFEQVRGGRGGAVETLPVVYFIGKAKGLLLKKTNARSITQIAGSAVTEDWPGVAIVLYETVDTFGTEQHQVIRIRPIAPAAPRRPRLVDETAIDLAGGKGQAY